MDGASCVVMLRGFDLLRVSLPVSLVRMTMPFVLAAGYVCGDPRWDAVICVRIAADTVAAAAMGWHCGPVALSWNLRHGETVAMMP